MVLIDCVLQWLNASLIHCYAAIGVCLINSLTVPANIIEANQLALPKDFAKVALS